MNFRKFKKNAKALSPVVASIILIAVTVAVSVVVAAWMGGMTIGLMGNAEQASATNPVYVSNKAVTVTIQNTGSSTVTISSATIDGNATSTNPSIPINVAKGTSVAVTITFSGANDQFTNTAQYTIKLQTAKGNTITTVYTYTGQ